MGVGFALFYLMTPGLSKDIQCHVWPYFFFLNLLTLKVLVTTIDAQWEGMGM